MYRNLEAFINEWKSNTTYFDMLALMASLSKLFSDSQVPYLDYRLTENLFCKYYCAINDARSCTAYDARLPQNIEATQNTGIGIKTFILNNNRSREKVAEFNKLSNELKGLRRYDLARKIAEFRNDRIDQSNGVYSVNEAHYHIVGRDKGCLKVFNSPYTKISIDNIVVTKDDDKSIYFHDQDYEYTFNKSKSVLMKNFSVPVDYKQVDVEIIEDPLALLSDLLKVQAKDNKNLIYFKGFQKSQQLIKGKDYVVLPLYSTRDHTVPARSGLNQWNAKGRKRDYNEIYIPVPSDIHKYYPDFFPNRNTPFELLLPNGKSLNVKICQDGGKALMSNPNSDLGNWLLRTVLRKKPGELVTIRDLNLYGIDSVRISYLHKINENGERVYSISFMNHEYESYNKFIE